MQFYFKDAEGKEEGPVNSAQLTALARRGKLARTDLVRQDGKSKWYSANSIQGLFESITETESSVMPEEEELVDLPVSVTSPYMPQRVGKSPYSINQMKWRKVSRFWSVAFSKMLAIYGYGGLLIQVWCWWRAIMLVSQFLANPPKQPGRAFQPPRGGIQIDAVQVIDGAMFLGYIGLLMTFPILVSVGLLWWSEVIEEQIRVTEARRRGTKLLD